MSLAHDLLNAVGQALCVVIELKEISSFLIIPNEDEIGDSFRLVIQILSKILKIVVFFYLPFLSPFLVLTSLHHSLIITKRIFYDTSVFPKALFLYFMHQNDPLLFLQSFLLHLILKMFGSNDFPKKAFTKRCKKNKQKKTNKKNSFETWVLKEKFVNLSKSLLC